MLGYTNDTAAEKPVGGTWSKKEMLGHLIDSASNNHQRFIRAMLDTAQDFPTYNQNRWVEVQNYNSMDWNDLVQFFTLYNQHLCRIVDNLPEEALRNPCNIGREDPMTLEFVVIDYLRHLKHHLDKF